MGQTRRKGVDVGRTIGQIQLITALIRGNTAGWPLTPRSTASTHHLPPQLPTVLSVHPPLLLPSARIPIANPVFLIEVAIWLTRISALRLRVW
jgi:hypothetical protein